MAAWPTVEDLAQWLPDNGGGSTVVLNEAFDAADEAVRKRVDETLLTEAGHAFDGTAPPEVRLAILTLAARWFARRHSVNGVVSFGEFAANVTRVDADIERQISDYRRPMLA